MRRCPRLARWATASDAAWRSSHETNGAGDVRRVAVDEHHRDALGDQLVVRRLVAFGVGVAPADHDDPGDPALDERARGTRARRRPASRSRARTCSRRRPGVPRGPGRGRGRSGCRARGRRRRPARPRAGGDARGRAAPSWSTACRTIDLVRSLTPGRPFMTRLTVASLTPARWATSRHRTRTALIVHCCTSCKE